QAGTGLVVLPRLTADRASDGDVFSTDGSLALVPADPSDPSSPLIFALKYGKGVVSGGWIRSRPGQVLAPDDTAPAWHSRVVSRTFVDREGNPVGRDMDSSARVTPAVEEARRHIKDIRTFREYNPATRQYGPRQKLPSFMFGAETYSVLAHGRPGEVAAELDDGSPHWHTGREHGEWLKRRASFQGLPEDAVRNQFACWAATSADTNLLPHRGARAPFVADPLAPRFEAAAQGTATSTGKAIGASLRATGLGPVTVDGKLTFDFVVTTDVRWGSGGVASWRLVEPVPSRAKLEHLAVAASLGGELETAERLVYALRRALGDGIDHDSGYEALVEGIGALELMRREDPLLRGFGPFTLDLLKWAARAWRGTPGGAEPTRDEYLHVLAEAARQAPGIRLTDFLPGMAGPVLKAAASSLVQMDEAAAADLAFRLLRLPDPQSVGDIERTRVLWAMAKATAWIGTVPARDLDRVAAKVLHGQGRDDAAGKREDLYNVAVSAAARGRDLEDERELAVVHLELLGAFGPGTAVSTSGGQPGGRNWQGDSRLTSWDSGQVHNFVQHAKKDAIRWEKAAPLPGAGVGEFPLYLLALGMSARPGHVEMVLGGVALQPPVDEVTLLASYDPNLLHADLKRNLVVAMPGVPPDALRDGLAGETGRFTRTFSGPTTMSHRAEGGSVLMATQVVPRRRVLGVSRSGKPRPMGELWQVTDPRDVIQGPSETIDVSNSPAQIILDDGGPQLPAQADSVTVSWPSWTEIDQELEELRAEAGASGVDVYRQALVDAFGPDVVRRPEYGGWYDQVVLLDELR
ncbi:lonely Cys domain-containing protein, partial [Streptomyces sp. NPDC048527]|uniref:lonely Cys domain-containing protein n=1 Tax=Streptomyces sp. NPDC048527 TaxID=3365568 RepID=UPI00371A6500